MSHLSKEDIVPNIVPKPDKTPGLLAEVNRQWLQITRNPKWMTVRSGLMEENLPKRDEQLDISTPFH